jgi:hypothetical protein
MFKCSTNPESTTDQSERDDPYAPTHHLSEGLLSEDVAIQTMYALSHVTVPEARKAIALIDDESWLFLHLEHHLELYCMKSL